MRSLRNWVRSHLGDPKAPEQSVYGPHYPPVYNLDKPFVDGIPDVYNAEGGKLDFYFLRDYHLAIDPYMVEYAAPNHWIWDRYNYGLKTHFYSHWEMLRTLGRPDRRFGMMIESDAIVPQDYAYLYAHSELASRFDLLFTYDERLLNEIDNARFVPFCAQPWYGTLQGGGILDEKAYERKAKMVSILSSAKTICELHRFRLDVANRCKREGLADTFGTFDGGPMVKIADTLRDYRYSIAIENSLSRYFFTERLTSCFLSMTVPIYCGTPHIGEFFNLDGIIIFRPGDDLLKILRQCSERDYESRLAAIKDNYARTLKYRNVWDWIHKTYLGGVS